MECLHRRGGVDVEDTLSTRDQYIQQCELLNDLAQISTLTYSMVLHYTGQVACIRLSGMTGTGKLPSALITDVSGYIHHHLSDPITTEEIAKHLFMGCPHLSCRFRQEAGMTLSAFIAKEKTEEAKRLLRYTDKTIAAIAAYLGYSSQGHFTQVFHRGTGITPGDSGISGDKQNGNQRKHMLKILPFFCCIIPTKWTRLHGHAIIHTEQPDSLDVVALFK